MKATTSLFCEREGGDSNDIDIENNELGNGVTLDSTMSEELNDASIDNPLLDKE